MQSSRWYNWFENNSISRRVQTFCKCNSFDETIDLNSLSISRRKWRSMITNKWSNHDQIIQQNVFESQSISQSSNWWYNWEQQSCQYQMSWRVQRWILCRCNLFNWYNWHEQSCRHSCHDFVLLTVKSLRRMKSWIVSKTSSKIAVRSNWTLNIMNVNVRWSVKKSRRFSKSDIFHAIATMTFFAFKILFSFKQLIDFE